MIQLCEPSRLCVFVAKNVWKSTSPDLPSPEIVHFVHAFYKSEPNWKKGFERSAATIFLVLSWLLILRCAVALNLVPFRAHGSFPGHINRKTLKYFRRAPKREPMLDRATALDQIKSVYFNTTGIKSQGFF